MTDVACHASLERLSRSNSGRPAMSAEAFTGGRMTVEWREPNRL
jgi:hypothetical protein